MGRTCAVYGCPSSGVRDKDRSFYGFPKDKVRCRQWKRASCRMDLMHKSEEELHKSYFICDLHFEASYHIVSKLKRNAVPTLMLPQEEFILGLTKSTQTKKLKCNNVEVQTCDFINSSTITATQPSAELSTRNTNKRNLLHDCKGEFKKQTLLENDVTMGSKSQADIPQWLQNVIDLQEKLDPHCRGNRYTKEFKLFALDLFLTGPMAYRVLGKLINLPSEKTLLKIDIDTGTKISSNVVKCLESKLQQLKEFEKYCVICADEMTLKRQLFYQINKDNIVGLHEIDGIQATKPATRAFVLMARGISRNWKQLVGYSLLTDSDNYDELNVWLNNVISKIIDIGFKVVAFVSNQGSSFLNLASSRDVTIETPYFFVNNHKIYYIFDVPNLVRSLRNNLMKYDIEYENYDGTKAVATWNDIKTFYALDNKRVFPIARELTESHINPNKSEKIEFKYVTQVFSKPVAAGMSFYIELGQLSSKSIGTVKLIELIYNTLDILNSSIVSNQSQNIKSLVDAPNQIKTLNQFLQYLNDVTIRNPENQKDITKTVKCIEGLKISLTSIMCLWEDLNSKGDKPLFTERLNQDILEDFFDSVRREIGNCRDPTPVQFSRAFRKLFMENICKPWEYVNYKKDLEYILVKADILATARFIKLEKNPQHVNDHSIMNVGRTDYRFDLPPQNSFRYVSGYLLRACHDIHQCKHINAYVESNKNITNDDVFFGNVIENSCSGFISPPENFVNFVRELDQCLVNVFNRKQFSGCLGKEILNSQRNINFVDCCSCFPNEYLKKLFVRFRIYNVIKFNNRLIKSKSFRFNCIKFPKL